MQKEKSLKEIVVKNVFYNFSSSIVNTSLSFLFVVFLARILKPDLYGIYGIVLSVVLLFSRFSDLGINTALVKYVSANIKNKKETQAYAHYLIRMKFFVVLVSSFLLLILAKPISMFSLHDPKLFYILLVAVIYLIISSITEFSAAFFSAFNEFKYYPRKEMIFQVSRIVLVFLFILLIGKTIFNVFVGLILSYLITFFFVFITIKKRYGFIFKYQKLPREKRKRVLRYVFYLTVTALGMAFFVYLSTIILSTFIEPRYVGFYRIAYSLVTILIEFSTIGLVLFPVFSFLKKSRLDGVFNKAFKYSMALSFPLAFILPITFKPIITFVYGIEYSQSIVPLYFLSSLIITQTAFTYITSLFYAREKPKWPVIIMIISSILNILLNYFLIKYFLSLSQLHAVVGATLATFISNAFYFICMAVAVKKVLGIRIEIQSISKPFFASAAMAGIILMINQFLTLTWFIAGLEIIFGFISYLLLMLLIKGLSVSEIVVLKSIFKK